jgi:CRISPR-associated protein Cas2
MRTVVAYDVSDGNSRAKLAAVLGAIGERLQKSVFLCDVPATDLEAALRRATAIIDHTTDSVHAFPQCSDCDTAVRAIGQAHVPAAVEYWIL